MKTSHTIGGLVLALFSMHAAAGPVVPRFESGPCPPSAASEAALTEARCGQLIVPENRAKQTGRTISLPVAVIPSKSEASATDPLVHLSGGPGADVFPEATYLVEAGYNRDREVIMMAQRGTLDAKPELTCPEIDNFNIQAVGMRYDGAKTKELHLAATRACHDRLVSEGIDLAAYNTFENAADFADLRKALKIGQWNVHAYSYGTDLALTLMRTHPEGIRSVILDSVVPPSVATLGWTWTSVEEGFGDLVDACDAQSHCRKRYPDLGGTFARLVNHLEESPMTIAATRPDGGKSVTVVLDGGALVNWLVGVRPPLSRIPSAIAELAEGHPAQIATARAALTDPHLVGRFSHGLAFGVFCREWVPFAPKSEILDQGRRAFPTFPDSVLALAPQLPYMDEDCKIWNVPAAPSAIRDVTRSDIPTLVVSGSFDTRTSPRWGEYAARTLTNSTNIVIPGAGHWAVISSPCAQSVAHSFLNTPKAPNTECVAGLKEPPFE